MDWNRPWVNFASPSQSIFTQRLSLSFLQRLFLSPIVYPSFGVSFCLLFPHYLFLSPSLSVSFTLLNDLFQLLSPTTLFYICLMSPFHDLTVVLIVSFCLFLFLPFYRVLSFSFLCLFLSLIVSFSLLLSLQFSLFIDFFFLFSPSILDNTNESHQLHLSVSLPIHFLSDTINPPLFLAFRQFKLSYHIISCYLSFSKTVS